MPALLFVLQESVDLGEIMYSLCYLPTAGRMTLTVIKCRNLKAMDITGSSGNQTAGCFLLSTVQTCRHRQVTVMSPRPVCEGLPGMCRTEVEEAKDHHQEEHTQPDVQRGHHLRHPSGERGASQPVHHGDGLRPVSSALEKRTTHVEFH